MSLIDAIIVSQTIITAKMHFQTPIFMKPPQHLYCLISGLDYDCSPNNFQLRYAQFKRGKTLQAIRDTVLIFKLKKRRKTFFFYFKRVFAQDWQVCLVNAKKIQTILTIKSFFYALACEKIFFSIFFVWNLNANMQLEERHLLQKCGQTQIGIFERKNHLIANSCFNFIFVSVERKKFLFWWQHSNIPSLTNNFCSEDLIF